MSSTSTSKSESQSANGLDGARIVDNTEANRFELRQDGEILSLADYRTQGDVVVVPHVETRVAHRGQGNAGKLMAGMLDLLEESGRTIKPVCPYAARYLQKHPERQHLLASS